MNKTARILLLLLLIALAIGCQAQPAKPSRSVTLAFTNDALGELADCGCKGGISGGIDRRAGLIADWKKNDGARLLAIEAGDFLYPVQPATDEERKVEELRAPLIAEAYRRAGYDAVLFGARDYALGVAPLKQAAQIMNIPILGANVLDAATNKPLWQPTLVLERGGLRVGLLGLVSDRKKIGIEELSLPAEIVIADPVAAAAQYAPLLRKECDLLVLVANLDYEQLQAVLTAVEGVDFVLKSRDAKMLTHQVQHNNDVPVVSVYELGRYVGRLDITLVEAGKKFADEGERQMLERKIARYQEYVDSLNKQAGGAEKIAEFLAGDASLQARYDRYKKNIERWQKELTDLREDGNRFRYDLVELTVSVPTDTELTRQVKAFEDEHGTTKAIRAKHAGATEPLSPPEVSVANPEE